MKRSDSDIIIQKAISQDVQEGERKWRESLDSMEAENLELRTRLSAQRGNLYNSAHVLTEKEKEMETMEAEH